VSGSAWFLLALAFDKGVEDFNIPVIPSNGIVATAASLLGAIVTGVCLALAFRTAWTSRSRLVLWATPLALLTLGIVGFSVCTWLVWLLVGGPSSVRPADQFQQVLGTFVVYGLLSVFTPVLYMLAFLNQVAIRHMLRTAAG
jgi:hypothetical protein